MDAFFLGFQSPDSKIVSFGILVFLWTHFLPGFQSPVSKRVSFGILVSTDTFVDTLDRGGLVVYPAVVSYLANFLDI